MLLRLLEQEKQIAASVRARVARRREENKKKPTKNDDKEKNVSSIFLSTVKIETIISLSLSLSRVRAENQNIEILRRQCKLSSCLLHLK